MAVVFYLPQCLYQSAAGTFTVFTVDCKMNTLLPDFVAEPAEDLKLLTPRVLRVATL